MWFTFVLFVAPQFIFPALQTLRPAMVSAGLAIVVYMADCLVRRKPLTVWVPAIRLILMFFVLAAASIPFSRWPGGSFDALVNELLKSVLIFIILANTLNTVRRIKLMIGSMVAWSIIMSWTAVREFSGGNLLLGGIRIYGYSSPLAANPNDLALTLNLVLALATGLYYAIRNPLSKLFLFGGMALLVSGVVSSFSRGGFLTLVSMLSVFLIKRVRERGAVGLWLVLVPLLAISFLPEGYSNRVYSTFDSTLDPTGSADARWDGMVLGWNLMLENPIAGLGLQMHGLALPEQGLGWSSVHNVFLQIGADLGIPALLVYLAAIWHIFKGMRQSLTRLKGLPDARELLALGHGIEVALVGFMVGASFHPVAYHFYFFYLAGFAVAFQEVAKRLGAKLASETGTVGNRGDELLPRMFKAEGLAGPTVNPRARDARPVEKFCDKGAL
jgi:hypothetical protein